jgi:hypothetical protein
MKKILFFVMMLSIISFIESFNDILYAKTAEDFVVVLENISDKCPHGRQLFFRDTDGDGEYDTMRKTNCDGSYEETPMSVSGSGSFDRPGAHAEVISGDIDSDVYLVKIYYPSDGQVLGYLEKTSSNPVVVFTFAGY